MKYVIAMMTKNLLFFDSNFDCSSTSAYSTLRESTLSYYQRHSPRKLNTMNRQSIFVLLALVLCSVNAFVTPRTPVSLQPSTTVTDVTSTSLSMSRQWNFNAGRGPFGMKNNAEIWNGRVGQMGFTVVLLQELITGKGVIQGLQDGDALSFILLGLTGVSVVGLSAFLAIKGKDKYINLEE
jgi:hypothetical protein